ncbi:MAG: hypothetical protein U0804_28585 [Gemmataceae bacterium]
MDGLLAALQKLIPTEVIDGTSVDDAAGLVDLSVAHTPVVENPAGDNYQFRIQRPVEVQKWSGGRWAVMYRERKDFRRVTEDEVKVMRARYLLLRGYYYRSFRHLPYPGQREVTAWYFPDGLWLPEAGSDLAKAMGVKE